MTNTTTTIETDFQVLDPIDVAPPGSTLAQYVESGFTQIPNGSQTLTVTFVTVKALDEYLFDELEVQNTVDAVPLVMSPEITSYNKNGFSVAFNGAPDSISYFLRWKIRIPT